MMKKNNIFPIIVVLLFCVIVSYNVGKSSVSNKNNETEKIMDAIMPMSTEAIETEQLEQTPLNTETVNNSDYIQDEYYEEMDLHISDKYIITQEDIDFENLPNDYTQLVYKYMVLKFDYDSLYEDYERLEEENYEIQEDYEDIVNELYDYEDCDNDISYSEPYSDEFMGLR